MTPVTCPRAPKRGHRKETARARCPHCGSFPGPGVTPPTETLIALPPGPEGVDRQTSPMECKRRRRIDEVLQLAGDLLVAESIREVHTHLLDFAVAYGEQGRGRARRHAICQVLAEVANALDPGEYIDEAADRIRTALTTAGLPRPVVALAIAATKKIAAGAVEGINPTEQIRLAIWMLISVLCPRPEVCPAQPKSGVEVLKEALEDAESAF